MQVILLPDTPERNLTAAFFDAEATCCFRTLSMAELPEFIANTAAQKFIVFDLKKLLRTCPELVIIDTASWFDVHLAAFLSDQTLGEADAAGCWQKFFPDTPRPDSEAQLIWQLYRFLAGAMQESELFNTIEMPLVPVVAAMEVRGIDLDAQALQKFNQELSGQIKAVEEKIFQLCGIKFNLNSPKQLGEVLFEKLSLDPGNKKSKKSPSTDAESLKKLSSQHPVIDEILLYRKLSKLNSTYAEGLLKHIASDGKIHSQFKLTATATGRLSSSEPNLQNLPAAGEYGGAIRKFFHARSGFVFLDADYSQIELRLLAHIANDPVMIQAFQNNEDIHTLTASQIFGVAPEAVTPELRRRAKAVNFGIVYGMSAFALANDLNITQKEAQNYIDSYFEKYSAVKHYLDQTVKTAKQQGYVETIFKRRRCLPELASKVFALRSFGERAALNTPIQGSAAELIKLAMIKVDKLLAQHNIDGGLILQVHDELLLTVPEDQQEAAAGLLRSGMENVIKLQVPLKVSLSCGKNYFDVTK